MEKEWIHPRRHQHSPTLHINTDPLVPYIAMVPTNTPFALALSSPHTLIQDIFSRSRKSSEEVPTAVSDEFRRAFPDSETRAKVPYLSRNTLQQLKGKTVRWKGMVQDNSMGNEIVLATLPGSSEPKCALYGADSLTTESAAGAEAATEAFSAPSGSDLTERSVLYAASLPGRSGWAKEADRRALALEEASSVGGVEDARAAEAPEGSTSSTTSYGVGEKIPMSNSADALGVLLKVSPHAGNDSALRGRLSNGSPFVCNVPLRSMTSQQPSHSKQAT